MSEWHLTIVMLMIVAAYGVVNSVYIAALFARIKKLERR